MNLYFGRLLIVDYCTEKGKKIGIILANGLIFTLESGHFNFETSKTYKYE